jgi:amino-acid N-acetyltransferase
MNFEFRTAESNDWDAVAALLTSVNLPLEGAREHLENFILSFDGDELVGVAGMEKYGNVGLLRSVATSRRGIGLGQALVQQALDSAALNGIRRVVLLTTTAADFFPRFGFRPIQREEAPIAAYQSIEFQGACPASSIVMLLEN